MTTRTAETITCTTCKHGSANRTAENRRSWIYLCTNGCVFTIDKSLNAAHARSTDPRTSHEAAARQTPAKLTDNRFAVLKCLASIGEATDETIAWTYMERGKYPKQSPSGIRTRRSELVTMGYVVNTGRTGTSAAGGRAIRWGLTPKGRSALAEQA